MYELVCMSSISAFNLSSSFTWLECSSSFTILQPQSFSFCPEDGDLSLGSNEQRYNRESLKKVFYLTGTPPYWLTAIDRMAWLSSPIAFFTGVLGLLSSYSRLIPSSQNWFLQFSTEKTRINLRWWCLSLNWVVIRTLRSNRSLGIGTGRQCFRS